MTRSSPSWSTPPSGAARSSAPPPWRRRRCHDRSTRHGRRAPRDDGAGARRVGTSRRSACRTPSGWSSSESTSLGRSPSPPCSSSSRSTSTVRSATPAGRSHCATRTTTRGPRRSRIALLRGRRTRGDSIGTPWSSPTWPCSPPIAHPTPRRIDSCRTCSAVSHSRAPDSQPRRRRRSPTDSNLPSISVRRGRRPSTTTRSPLTPWNAGRWDDVQAETEAGLRYAREHDIGLVASWACALGATALLFRGDLAGAEALLDEGDARLAAGGVQYGIDWLLRGRALLLEAQGRLGGRAGDAAPRVGSRREPPSIGHARPARPRPRPHRPRSR